MEILVTTCYSADNVQVWQKICVLFLDQITDAPDGVVGGVPLQTQKLGAKGPGALRAPLAIVALVQHVSVQGHVAAVGGIGDLEFLASNDRWGGAATDLKRQELPVDKRSAANRNVPERVETFRSHHAI